MGKTVNSKNEQQSVKDEHENDIPTPVVEEEYVPLNLEQQVTVRSIAGWTTGFSRLITVGDVSIPLRGTIRLSRNEIISQVHAGNALLAGVDGKGNHATLIIEDDATLKELGFEEAIQFSDKAVKKIFGISDQSAFEYNLKETIVTRAEKYALMVSIVKQKLNDYSKIRFCEEYTGYKLQNVAKDEKNSL